MLRVYVKPSAIWIAPYGKGLCGPLEKTLSLYDIHTHRYTSFLYEYDADEGSNTGVLKVPRGLGVETVENMLKLCNLQYTIIDDTSVFASPRKTHFGMKKEPKDETQHEAVDFLNNTPERQLFLTLDVGRGKTFCAVKHIHDQGYAALIVSYNLSNQWYARITDYTDCVGGKDVVLIVGSAYLEDCVAKKVIPKAAIYIVSVSTLMSYAKTHGTQSLQKVAEVLGIAIKVFDEAHTRYLQYTTIDLNMQVSETLYLTATPGRSAHQENKLYTKIYSEVKAHGAHTALLNNHYTVRFITYDSHSTSGDRMKIKTSRGLNSIRYSRYLFDKAGSKILNLIKQYMLPIFDDDKDARVLIIIDWLKDIEFAKSFYEADEEVVARKLTIGTHCQLVKGRENKENQLDRNIIFGTLGSMQNGKDIANLRAIFPVVQYSSPIVARQVLGRLRPVPNKEVYFYDMADISVPDITRQRNMRKPVFEPRSIASIEEDHVDLFSEYSNL